jgi:hypothetical protein
LVYGVAIPLGKFITGNERWNGITIHNPYFSDNTFALIGIVTKLPNTQDVYIYIYIYKDRIIIIIIILKGKNWKKKCKTETKFFSG